MKRKSKEQAKRLLRRSFERMQRLGFNILPRHFYSQVPEIAKLRTTDHWRAPMSMIGVQGSEIADQLHFVSDCCPPEIREALPDLDIHGTALRENDVDSGYGPIEADFLYAFIRKQKPKKIVQVGCGVSTSIILRAADDAGYQPEVICVEPYPGAFLFTAEARGRIRLIQKQAQLIDLKELTTLEENDLFFVDSTHTVKPGSEVNRIILEVLPRLKKGTWVHFHDILFPYDYSRGLLDDDLFFWSESTLLHAFLASNQRYTIRASLSMLHYEAPDELRSILTRYIPQANSNGLRTEVENHFPAVLFLQVL